MAEESSKPPIDVEEHVTPFDLERVEAKKVYHTLTEMGEEFEFFTTALLSTAGRFDRDPLVEFMKVRQLDAALAPFAIDCPEPFFQGLGIGLLLGSPVNWDHRLYAIRRDVWPELRDTVAGMAWADQGRRYYAQALFHELQIVDHTRMQREAALLSSLPMLTITVFAVSSNRAFSYIAPARKPPLTRAFYKVEPARREMQREAARVLGPPISPETLSRHRKPSA